MVDTVIVALPAEDDYVNRLSSQKAPHLTLMYLGEEFNEDNLELVVRYIKHIAETSMRRFGLSVDRRGTLGDKDADVLFFEKGWQTKELKTVIGYLLADDAISLAYNQLKNKFPDWIPHLTMGYPDDPAKPDEREYPGIRYVNFDRIAIWTGDSEGPEFRLKDYEMSEDLAMSDEASLGASFAEYFMNEEVLEHYGTKGMQWGKRKMVDTGVLTTSTAKLDAKASAKENKANAKGDKKFIKENTGMNGFIKVNNGIADKINPRLDVMNAAHQKKHGDVDLMDPKNSKIQKEYAESYKRELQKSLDEMATEIGTNASGTIKADLKVIDNGYPDISYEYTLNEVKHADGETVGVITPKFNAKGFIVGQNFKIVVPEELAHSEAFAEFFNSDDEDLMHYGVKGMQWGVRTKGRTPTGVALTTKPGQKVKAKGGKFEEASEDAKKAAVLKQKAKSSSTDSLSNTEMKQLIERMNLEANYNRMAAQSAGSVIVKKLLSEPKYRNQQVEGISKLTMPVRTGVGAATGVGRTIRKTDLSGIGS